MTKVTEFIEYLMTSDEWFNLAFLVICVIIGIILGGAVVALGHEIKRLIKQL